MNVDDFIKQHKHTCYCEAIIDEHGDIEYAIPSHQKYLMNLYCKRYKCSEDDLRNAMPATANPNYWLVDKLDCSILWYNNCVTGHTVNAKMHADIIKKLISNSVMSNNVVMHITDEYYRTTVCKDLDWSTIVDYRASYTISVDGEEDEN